MTNEKTFQEEVFEVIAPRMPFNQAPRIVGFENMITGAATPEDLSKSAIKTATLVSHLVSKLSEAGVLSGPEVSELLGKISKM